MHGWGLMYKSLTHEQRTHVPAPCQMVLSPSVSHPTHSSLTVPEGQGLGTILLSGQQEFTSRFTGKLLWVRFRMFYMVFQVNSNIFACSLQWAGISQLQIQRCRVPPIPKSWSLGLPSFWSMGCAVMARAHAQSQWAFSIRKMDIPVYCFRAQRKKEAAPAIYLFFWITVSLGAFHCFCWLWFACYAAICERKAEMKK